MKKEYIILTVIILILAAYLVFHKVGSTHYTLPKMNDISGTDITKLDITKNGKTVTVEKQGDKWVVGADKYPANDSLVSSMVKTVKNMKLTTLIAESGNYNRYDLDNENKITVTAWNNGNAVRTFEVGKTASTYRHTFVKIDKDQRVFHAEENFRPMFEKTEDGIANKEILRFDAASIKGVNVVSGDKTVALEQKKDTVTGEQKKDDTQAQIKPENKPAAPKANETWLNAAGKEVEKAKVSELISSLNNLQCDTYIKGAKKEDFQNPIFTITLSGAKPYTLTIYNKKDEKEGYPAVSSENAFFVTLPAAKIDEIKNKLNGF